MLAPLKITLYSPTDEPTEYTRKIVPFGFLKQAIELSTEIGDGETVSAELLDAIGDLVVQVFGGQFTLDDLNNGADQGEVIAVLTSIIARANTLIKANPTLPSVKSKH